VNGNRKARVKDVWLCIIAGTVTFVVVVTGVWVIAAVAFWITDWDRAPQLFYAVMGVFFLSGLTTMYPALLSFLRRRFNG
jgi:uncharacterized membrane protein